MATQAAKEPGLRAVGVPASHYALLMHVHIYPGLTGAELGRRLGVTTQAVALLATKLEAAGLLERRTHPRHRNVQELHLTDAGLAALHSADAVITDTERRITDALGPERSEQLRSLLDELTEVLASDRTPSAGSRRSGAGRSRAD
ncbi:MULTISPECIES: MarR family winged helix-turn-helix transcriptional regulator [unclassified Streptomyces]|uniref:MarR family winged helix-turn-helix transcriptional regulator n=1 Tax=unclassified Streptomyces TaxID=2593676 RepID=UPI0037FE71A0